MANNNTDVPRCIDCGKYMEKVEESSTTVIYGCCGETTVRRKPEERTVPLHDPRVR